MPNETTELVSDLRSLADCDARAGAPLGQCMRRAADEIERLRGEVGRLRERMAFFKVPPTGDWEMS